VVPEHHRIDVGAPPLPSRKPASASSVGTRGLREGLHALRARRDDCGRRSGLLRTVGRSRAWVMARRIAHTAHHRGNKTTLLRMLNRELYSTYGPTPHRRAVPHRGPRCMPIRRVCAVSGEARAPEAALPPLEAHRSRSAPARLIIPGASSSLNRDGGIEPATPEPMANRYWPSYDTK